MIPSQRGKSAQFLPQIGRCFWGPQQEKRPRETFYLGREKKVADEALESWGKKGRVDNQTFLALLPLARSGVPNPTEKRSSRDDDDDDAERETSLFRSGFPLCSNSIIVQVFHSERKVIFTKAPRLRFKASISYSRHSPMEGGAKIFQSFISSGVDVVDQWTGAFWPRPQLGRRHQPTPHGRLHSRQPPASRLLHRHRQPLRVRLLRPDGDLEVAVVASLSALLDQTKTKIPARGGVVTESSLVSDWGL